MTHEEKQIHNAVHCELKEYEEFKTLVKKMRELQKEQESADLDFSNLSYYEEQYKKMRKKESEVDKWLEELL